MTQYWLCYPGIYIRLTDHPYLTQIVLKNGALPNNLKNTESHMVFVLSWQWKRKQQWVSQRMSHECVIVGPAIDKWGVELCV